MPKMVTDTEDTRIQHVVDSPATVLANRREWKLKTYFLHKAGV